MADDPFPQAQPTRDTIPAILMPYFAFAATRLGSWCARTVITPVDRRLLRLSHGHVTIVGSSALRVLVLTTTGRKSGRHRAIALTYIRDHDRLLVLGSNFGQPHHPEWSANLLADPHATVTVGGADIPVTATLLTGQQRQRALARFRVLNLYRQYDDRTARQLRLFALTRHRT